MNLVSQSNDGSQYVVIMTPNEYDWVNGLMSQQGMISGVQQLMTQTQQALTTYQQGVNPPA